MRSLQIFATSDYTLLVNEVQPQPRQMLVSPVGFRRFWPHSLMDCVSAFLPHAHVEIHSVTVSEKEERPMITKNVTCPIDGCGEEFELDLDPADPDQEVDCPECHGILGIEYDAATDSVTLVELMGEDDEEADELSLVEDLEEEEEIENE